jgi:hypothetical protein
MTPRFLRIAKDINVSDLSVIVDDDGVPFLNPEDRAEHVTGFYETLYKLPDTVPDNFTNCVSEFLGDLTNHPAIRGCMLTEEERGRLEADVTITELDEAVEKINLGSAPGIGGLNNRFIKKFWVMFRVPLYEYTMDCIRNRKLTGTFRTALIRLIPKKGDISKIKNWRPISLLSCFYKVISKAVNTRLDSVIDKVTSLDQKAYNKNRFIQEALICTIDTIRHCENNGIKGAILSIDQKKAFDSVYHGYMREVYKFFNFGGKFIDLLETIGNGRTAKILLENDKPSREIDLDRGFAQGNGPSPKKYNIGEQILLFRLSYDPSIFGVYASFLVPRAVRDGETVYPRVEEAEGKDLTVDKELLHTNGKTPAFADDTTGAFKRDVENLSRVKNVLLEFGVISGLETNVEKTSLMPVGCLDEPIEQEIIDLGFEIVDSIKCLGLVINNKADGLTNHFDEKVTKIRQLIGLWGRYNLSLTGRIAISKTMLVSQIGYIGCIITPTAQQVTTLQSLINDYVTSGTVVAADRLYTCPCEGGLGLIKLESYLSALQCSWVKRCYTRINDSWRWILASV